jgi:hypothetical protein
MAGPVIDPGLRSGTSLAAWYRPPGVARADAAPETDTPTWRGRRAASGTWHSADQHKPGQPADWDSVATPLHAL